MFSSCKWSLGPIPESINNCGDCTEPADSIISRFAFTILRADPSRNCTPWAVFPFLSENRDVFSLIIFIIFVRFYYFVSLLYCFIVLLFYYFIIILSTHVSSCTILGFQKKFGSTRRSRLWQVWKIFRLKFLSRCRIHYGIAKTRNLQFYNFWKILQFLENFTIFQRNFSQIAVFKRIFKYIFHFPIFDLWQSWIKVSPFLSNKRTIATIDHEHYQLLTEIVKIWSYTIVYDGKLP